MKLSGFFRQNSRAALAFSGGVDSAYLLYAAVNCGADVQPYFVKSAFQPQFELQDARRLAQQLEVKLTVLPLDILASPEVTANPSDRCYHCKRAIFSTIVAAARQDGYSLLLDGTNASDVEDDRPGMRALRELEVRSPLRECGLTKKEIRRMSRDAGLFTWDKPAYACLATRIPSGTAITGQALERAEEAENYLFSLGLRDFRVRSLNDCARIQVPAAQLPIVLEHRVEIKAELRQYYSGVLLDLEARDE